MAGRCQFCGCTDLRGCAFGCAWVDRAHTLCSECLDVRRAYAALPLAHRRQSTPRAFGRGWFARRDDEGESSPYAEDGPAGRTWQRGFEAASRWLTQETDRREAIH